MNEFLTFLVSVGYLIGIMTATNVLMFFLTRRITRELHGSAPWSWWVLCGYSTYIWFVFDEDIWR